MEKRTQLITIWGVVGSIFVGGAILWLVSAAPKTSNLPRWPALPLALVGIGGLYCMFAAYRSSWPFRGERAGPPLPAESRASPPDLITAADARVAAVMTHGPARNPRLSRSRLDLQLAADSLGNDERATKARALARELADCTDPDRAVDLRNRLVGESR